MFMWWNTIVSWFTNLGERDRCINDFNRAAQNAFINGTAPVYLKAQKSRGNSSYKHSMSNWMYSGFSINTLSGTYLSSSDVQHCGMVIISNQELMRQLATLGFDTLEIYHPDGYKVCDWKISAIMQLR